MENKSKTKIKSKSEENVILKVVPKQLNSDLFVIIDKLISTYKNITFEIDFRDLDSSHKISEYNRNNTPFVLVGFSPLSQVYNHPELKELECYYWRF